MRLYSAIVIVVLRVSIGSNFTLGGFNKNDENFLIIYDEGLALKYVEEFDKIYN